MKRPERVAAVEEIEESESPTISSGTATGRQLATLTENGTTWSYTYGADGLRTSRTNGTTTYTYTYNGSQLVQMTVGEDTLRFTYDAAGTPLSVNYNGTTYYYATNIQGDVVAIVDASGVEQVRYTYGAWGQLLATEGTMAATLGADNPLRYRGYVYDQETALYYLQSRYYDPSAGRFINQDAFAATGQGLVGNNMFAYCGNNPARFYDPSGHAYNTIDGRTPIIGSRGGLVDSGGGGLSGIPGSGGGCGRQHLFDLIQREIDFYNNTDEQVVLESEGLSFYYGVPVIKADLGNGGAFSFGIIIMDDDYIYNSYGVMTLKHEYGHKLHMDEIGVINYAVTTALPSLICAGLENAGIIDVHYFSLPWEYVADMYGGVKRTGYTQWASKYAFSFWTCTIAISILTGGV